MMIVSAHIDDTLMVCESLDTLQAFKREFLTRQAVYAKKILQLYKAWDKPTVKTQLEAGVRLGITGHISFLVTMTQCDLAFAYAELSKFVQCQGLIHLTAAEHMLQFLRGSYEDGITYSNPGPRNRNRLAGWVDSDYTSDPDTRKSVTCYVLSLNNAPVSWKAKRQDCVTLSSAEAEYLAVSMAGQEVVYLRAILLGLGHEQVATTE
eukprot:2767961-Rhodomonas_salina.1